MTESIFDPTGPETEHSGTRNLGADGNDVSQMPPDLIDGKVEPNANESDEDDATTQIADAEARRDRERPDKTRPE